MARASTGWRPGRAGYRQPGARQALASEGPPWLSLRDPSPSPRSRPQSDAWRDLRRTIAAMQFGLCLPNFPDGASPEGIEAGASVAERVGWSTVWTTDHVLVPHDDAGEYGRIYDAILTLAWVGARHPGIRLGTSVIVVPQRNAVVLDKELATLDSLSGGRVIAGVGIGWNEREFANLAAADRFHVRGAYLDEAIRLWRHLWSGTTEPFQGRFHTIEGFVLRPLP